MYQYEMHKSYGDVIRSMLDTDKKLKQMVAEVRDDDLITESDEEAEEELVEIQNADAHDDPPHQKSNIIQDEQVPAKDADEYETADQIVNSILRKPAEKRPRSGQIKDVTEGSIKRQRLDDLEKAYHELILANDQFQSKCSEYLQLKKSIDFINTPNFLKFK